MPTTITGGVEAHTIVDTVTPTVVVPTPGDLAAANVVRAAVQRALDYISSLAEDTYNKEIYGVARIRTVGNVAAIRAMTGVTEGELVLLLNSGYDDGAIDDLVHGVGLYVFDPSSVAPERAIPNVPNGYLVIQPTVGVGRWLHISAGLGFTLGSRPGFVPRPIDRIRPVGASSGGSGFGNTAGLDGDYVPITAPNAIQFNIGMAVNDEVLMHASFDTRSSTSGTDDYTMHLEVSVGGGTWQPVLGTEAVIDVANGVTSHLTLSGYYKAGANAIHGFRVAVLSKTGQTIQTSESWSFRGTAFSSL